MMSESTPMYINGPSAGWCVVCGRAGRACSRCLTTHYCSPAHQRSHWSRHRAGCAPYQLRDHPTIGRYLLAKRDIPQGTIILRELPLVLLPATDSSQWVCVGCCRVLEETTPLGALLWARCSQCGWPVCNATCERRPWHREECRMMRRADFRFRDEHVRRRSGDWLLVLGTLRCALACRQLQQLHALQGEPHPAALAPQNPLALDARHEFRRSLRARAAAVRDFLGVSWISETELFDAAVLVAINGIFVGGEDMQYSATGILPGVSMVQHSCVPNLRLATLDPSAGTFESVLVAVRAVRAGQALSLSYVHDPYLSTLERRLLCGYGFFSCHCERCQDDSEFGLHISAWCCRACKRTNRQSMMLLRAPLESPSLSWECEACGRPAEAGEADWEMVGLEDELSALLRRGGSYMDLELFINRHSFPSGSCHQSHRVLLRAKRAVLDALAPERLDQMCLTQEDSFNLIVRREALCHELLGILGILKPGTSLHRRQMLAYLSESVLVRVNLGILSERLPFVLAQSEIEGNSSVMEELERCMVTPKEKEKWEELVAEVNTGLYRLRHCMVPWPLAPAEPTPQPPDADC